MGLWVRVGGRDGGLQERWSGSYIEEQDRVGLGLIVLNGRAE